MEQKLAIPLEPKVDGVYRHYGNGHEYKVIGFALDSDAEGDVWRVEYAPLYEAKVSEFSRSLAGWLAQATKDGQQVVRYQFIRMDVS